VTWLEEYGTAVLDGKIVAGKRIKQMYERLLTAMYCPGEFHFDADIAYDHIDFIETFCKQAQGRMGTPLKLALFQKAKLQAVFGFVDDNDLRQCNEALTVEGRKNGKTTEVAAVELDMLVNDDEGSPEIYNLATKLDQAGKGFDECWKMVRQSPALRSLIRKRRADLWFSTNMGFIKALASNTNGLDGLNAHCAVIDELAAIKNRDIYDLVKQSMSARCQPLLFEITTNGFVRDCIFDDQYKYACGVLDNKIKNNRFFPFIYELDDADEWDKEEMWIKANPGIDIIKSREFLRDCVQKAKDDPAFKPTVMVKDFCLKENSAAAWLRWDELNNEETFDIKFDYAIGGFDAADTTDLNAAKALMMRPGDPHIYVKQMYWIPETVANQLTSDGIRRERDNAPYELWIKQGLMRTYPGNKVEKRVFLDWFIELRETDGLYLLYFGYDPWHIDDALVSQFKAEFGQNSMIPVRQGTFTLSAPMKELKADLGAHMVVYNDNPIDKFCLLNTDVKSDVNGNIQPVKMLDPRKRIDGTMALICGYKALKDKMDEYINLNEGR
jgi:phage terminase large subunit-like protein